MQQIRYRLDVKNRIATLVIDTPGPVNTIGEQFIADLAAATQRATTDCASGVILSSAKQKSFLDGADLGEIRKNPSPSRFEVLLRSYHRAA